MSEPITVKIEVTGTAVVIKNIQEMNKKMLLRIKDAVNVSALEIQMIAKNLAPVGASAGGLRAGINVRKFYNGLAAGIGPRTDGTESGFSYGLAVEYGREPGKKMPPPEALEPWVEKKWGLDSWKGISSNSSTVTKKGVQRSLSTRTKIGITKMRVSSAAWVLARYIGKHGTKPHPFMLPAFEYVKPRFIQRLSEVTK